MYNVQHRIIRKIYKSNYSNIIRYYSTGIIVKNMVLLLNYRARGAPSLGPTPRDGPLPHSPGVPRPGPPPATCLGPKAAPYASIFPIGPLIKFTRPHHIKYFFFTSRNMNNMNISIEN